jgi:hypothetical protein
MQRLVYNMHHHSRFGAATLTWNNFSWLRLALTSERQITERRGRSQSAEADLPHKCDQPEKRSSPPRLRAHKSGYPLITCEYILHTLYIFCISTSYIILLTQALLLGKVKTDRKLLHTAML